MLAILIAIAAGSINPIVTQSNIATTICVSGWTKTIRPPASYTNKLKLQQMAAQHIAGKSSDFEEDHEISLEIGGNPNDPANLWPQPWAGPWNAHDKDRLENALHRAVCAHNIQLGDAQRMISTDWHAAYIRMFGSAPSDAH